MFSCVWLFYCPHRLHCNHSFIRPQPPPCASWVPGGLEVVAWNLLWQISVSWLPKIPWYPAAPSQTRHHNGEDISHHTTSAWGVLFVILSLSSWGWGLEMFHAAWSRLWLVDEQVRQLKLGSTVLWPYMLRTWLGTYFSWCLRPMVSCWQKSSPPFPISSGHSAEATICTNYMYIIRYLTSK